MALIKFNCDQACMEFFSAIREEPDILRAIQSGQKYQQSQNRIKNRALQLNNDAIVVTNDKEC